MSQKTEWTTADFDSLSWHDCHFHGFHLEEREHGTAEVEFDIDFIVEWVCGTDGTCEFRVAPATLTFHEVFGLRIEVDYAGASAAITPFAIDGIEREEIRHPTGPASFRWRLPVNWPSGAITFESPGFTQKLRGAPILVSRQLLLPQERNALTGAAKMRDSGRG
jgi:hypothetical protein